MHFTGAFLHLVCLISCSLSCSVVDCLHFAELDKELYYFSERLFQKVDLDGS